MRSGSRLRLISVVALVVLDGVVLLASTQPWFAFQADGQRLDVTGATAAGAAVPLALAGLLLAVALLIAGPAFRLVLAVLQALLGGVLALTTAIAIADPVAAARSAIEQATGVAGGDSAAAIVAGESSTAWPAVSLAAGILLALAGVGLLATVRRWPVTARRYERTRLAGEDGRPLDAVDEWDALSDGEDPTRDPR